jgi:serine phosphatase RsbU (regulator of sigma subunit)
VTLFWQRKFIALLRALQFAVVTFAAIFALRGWAFPGDHELPSLEQPTLLNSAWEYRLGDSPRRSNGVPDWIVSEESIAWVRAGSLNNVQFPRGQRVMWLRVRLPSKSWAGPSLLIENSSMLFQVYMGGRLLYPTEAFDADSHLNRGTLRWHIVPLLGNTASQHVYFRVLQPHPSEPLGRFSIGAQHAHYKAVVNASLWRIVLGVLAILIGASALVASVFRKMEKLTLAFAAMAASAGVYMLCSAPLRLQWMNTPFFWSFLEYGALFLVPAAFYWFLGEFLGDSSKNMTKVLLKVQIGFATFAQIAALAGLASYRTLLLGFFVCSLGSVVVVGKTLLQGFRTLPADLRVPFAAIVLMLISAVAEMISWSLDARALSVWPGAFVVSLSGVVFSVAYAILRSAMVQEGSLRRLNGLLERSVSAVVELSASSEIVTAALKTAETMVRELHVEAECSVLVYIRQDHAQGESPLYQQVVLVSQGRLVSHPAVNPLRQKHEAMAEKYNSEPIPRVNSKRMLIIPVGVGERKWGFFTIDNYQFEDPHPDDVLLLKVLCETLSHTILALEVRDYSLLEVKQENESKITSALQRFLIPDSIQIPGSLVASKYRAATTTGGDWFGYHVHANKDRADIFLGDATGHGMKSALLVAHASGAIRAALSRFSEGLPVSDEERLLRLARNLNKAVYEVGREELYMAMLFMSIDLESGTVLYVNAGHPPFYKLDVQSGRSQSVVPAPSQALGFSKASVFNVERLHLQRGDILFLSSSGLFDNEGDSGRRFSSRRLKSILEKSKEPQEILNLVTSAAEGVWKDTPLRDDVTTLVLKWLGSNRGSQQLPISQVDKKVV